MYLRISTPRLMPCPGKILHYFSVWLSKTSVKPHAKYPAKSGPCIKFGLKTNCQFPVVGVMARRGKMSSSSSGSLQISTARMLQVVESLKCKKNCSSTKVNYQSIWRQFNHFLVRLDRLLPMWEDQAVLFCAHLVETGKQSAMVKSYLSAIKSILSDDDYKWCDHNVLLTTLTRACRTVNDRVLIRLPIGKELLEMILFELQCILDGQWYLLIMYHALFTLTYYGLFRVGKLAKGTHPVRAADMHLARNKNKLRLLLWTSKNLVLGHSPQQVKITEEVQNNKTAGKFSHFCPFKLTSEFLRIRGGYKNKFEQFFVLQDSSPVTVTMVRTMLKKIN